MRALTAGEEPHLGGQPVLQPQAQGGQQGPVALPLGAGDAPVEVPVGIMMDAGRVVVDISGPEKEKLTVPDLLALFSVGSLGVLYARRAAKSIGRIYKNIL